jgi:hypothetical protein
VRRRLMDVLFEDDFLDERRPRPELAVREF